MAVALLATAVSACGHAADPAGSSSAAEPLIVCTTAMVGDLVVEIAGDDARVEVLFGAHVDPHLFRPTRDDVALLMRSDLVVHNGLGLEGYLDETLRRVGERGIEVLPIAERLLPADELLAHGETPDPHLWMDPSTWSLACEPIAGAVLAAFESKGSGGGDVRARADALAARLVSIDADFAERLGALPPTHRVLVTAHDAFGYFGRRYGLEVEAIQGVSTASEAGLLAIEELVDRIVDAKIPAVFFESTVSERNVRALVEGAAAHGHEVRIGGVLHSDAPGDAVTYEAMIEHNVATILAALAPTGSPEPEEAAR